MQQARNFGGAGEHHAFDALIADQTGADGFTATRQQLQHALRNPGFEHQAHGLSGNQRSLLGRFGQYRVTGSQCCSHLAAEDRQREVPRADAHYRTQWTVGVVAEIVARLYCVVTQEVDRFADFGDGVGVGLAGFTSQQAHQWLNLAFHQVSGTFQNRRTFGRRGGLPDRSSVQCALDSVVDVFDGSFLNMPDHIAVIRRIQHWCRGFVARRATEHRRSFPVGMGRGEQGAGQRSQTMFVGHVDAAGVGAFGTVQITRQRNARVR
ncbi:hypothetical protein D3C76_767150 [compost metagenome]